MCKTHADQSSLFSVVSFNVRGLSSKFRRDEVRRDLRRHQIDVCTLQETKLSSDLDTEEGGYRFICPAPECRHHGLRFVVSSASSNQIEKFWTLSDRVAVLAFRTRSPGTANTSTQLGLGTATTTVAIINVYAPTSTKK